MPQSAFLNLSVKTQDRILLAGAEILSEKGMRIAALEDVAERARVSIESLSLYFDGIPDLIASVLGRGIQYFNQTYIEVGGDEVSFWDRLERLLVLAARRGHQFGVYLNIYFNIGGSGIPELVRATYKRFEGRAAMFFQNLILSGLQEGVLRKDLDVAGMAYHFQDVTRLLMTRRAHPLYTARSEVYFPDFPLNDEGDRELIRQMMAYLKVLYAT